MYTYAGMATHDEPPAAVASRSSVDSNSEEHGFTRDWVENHSNRVAQRQLEVHDVPRGTPRTQIHQEEEESQRDNVQIIKIRLNIFFSRGCKTGFGGFYLLQCFGWQSFVIWRLEHYVGLLCSNTHCMISHYLKIFFS
jgi:hypothetical protein